MPDYVSQIKKLVARYEVQARKQIKMLQGRAKAQLPRRRAQLLTAVRRLRKGVKDDDAWVRDAVAEAGLIDIANVFFLQRYGFAAKRTEWDEPFLVGANFAMLNPDGQLFGPDLIAASDEPLRYEILRHMLRVSEETMTEVLEEAVSASLVKRGPNPFTYVPFNEAIGKDIRAALGEDRLARLQQQISGASKRVLEME